MAAEVSVTVGAHAVVIGAGIAGLLAARALAEFYERVTVLDRDDLPAHDAHRPGVPQGRHVHALLAGGALAIGELFPGLIAELVADGVPSGDILGDGRVYFEGHRMVRVRSGLPALGVTRPYLEHRIRRRLDDQANVSIVAGCAAAGLASSNDGSSVTGVVVTPAAGEGVEVLAADLVVDASGRGSHLPRWLADIGYQPPDEDRVGIDVAYATCVLALPPDDLDGDLGIAVGATIATPRGGAVMRVEQRRCLVSLAGYRGHHPPVTHEAFLGYAKSLAVPDIYHAVRAADPLHPPVRYRVPYAVRRRYERLARFPDRLVVLGDAVTSFNPVYGQGMTVAAEQALILRRCLRQGPSTLGSARREVARAAAVAWTMSISSDLRMPWIAGSRTPLVRFANAYASRLYRAARDDAVVAVAFMRIANLVDPAIHIVRPAIALRVLGRGGHRRQVVPAAQHVRPLATEPDEGAGSP